MVVWHVVVVAMVFLGSFLVDWAHPPPPAVARSAVTIAAEDIGDQECLLACSLADEVADSNTTATRDDQDF